MQAKFRVWASNSDEARMNGIRTDQIFIRRTRIQIPPTRGSACRASSSCRPPPMRSGRKPLISQAKNTTSGQSPSLLFNHHHRQPVVLETDGLSVVDFVVHPSRVIGRGRCTVGDKSTLRRNLWRIVVEICSVLSRIRLLSCSGFCLRCLAETSGEDRL